MKILLTGFSSFPGMPENPTEHVVNTLAQENWCPADDVTIQYRVLPCTYAAVTTFCDDVFSSAPPDIFIQLGVNAHATGIYPEAVAHNAVDCTKPDSDGCSYRENDVPLPQGTEGICFPHHPVVPHGPMTLPSRLPVREITTALTEACLPVEASDNAGAYLCNFIFYRSLHKIYHDDLPVYAGFIHVPMTTGQASATADGENPFTMCEKDLIRSIRIIVQACLQHARKNPVLS